MALFDKFKSSISMGAARPSFALGEESGYSVFYIPFEAVNEDAKLVLVGITPGPKQMTTAYGFARRLLASGLSDDEILRRTKQAAAFYGMRDKINEMLDHFEIPECIGATAAARLWGAESGFFDATSVVPDAAFKGEKCFNGPFTTILNNSLLRSEFETRFIPSIKTYTNQTMYIGMGPVVDDALSWCAAHGIIQNEQILGYLPHASGASGSQFSYFMHRKLLDDLKPRDPVRNRAAKLDAAHARMRQNVDKWRQISVVA